MKTYNPWDFCRSIDCIRLVRTEDQRKQMCKDCRAYQMHDYLREYGLILEEDSVLSAKIEQLENDFIAMTAEKERCRKLAVDYSLMADSYKARLERCENMKLAYEFEELLGTTSIPVAVEKLKELLLKQKALELAHAKFLRETAKYGFTTPADINSWLTIAKGVD